MLLRLYREKLHIVACAVAATWAWARVLGSYTTGAELSLVACIVAFVYGLNRCTDREEDLLNDPVSIAHPILLVILCFLLLAIVTILVYLRSLLCVVISIVVLTLGISYSLRIVAGFRLKQHWLSKNTSSALGWSLLTVSLPAVNHGVAVGLAFAVAFVYMFSSTLMIEILWDIRDRVGDSAAGIKTLATVSESFAWRAISVVNGVSILVFMAFFTTQHPPLAWLLVCCSASLLAVVCAASGWIVPRLRSWSHHLVSAEAALLIALGLTARHG